MLERGLIRLNTDGYTSFFHRSLQCTRAVLGDLSVTTVGIVFGSTGTSFAGSIFGRILVLGFQTQSTFILDIFHSSGHLASATSVTSISQDTSILMKMIKKLNFSLSNCS